MSSNKLVEALLNGEDPAAHHQSRSGADPIDELAEKLYNDLKASGVKLHGYSFNPRTRTATFASGMDTSNHEAMVSNFKRLAVKHSAVLRRSGRSYDSLTMVVGWPT